MKLVKLVVMKISSIRSLFISPKQIQGSKVMKCQYRIDWRFLQVMIQIKDAYQVVQFAKNMQNLEIEGHISGRWSLLNDGSNYYAISTIKD